MDAEAVRAPAVGAEAFASLLPRVNGLEAALARTDRTFFVIKYKIFNYIQFVYFTPISFDICNIS